MFNSSVIDVAIGLIFVYLVLGLMCTTVNEWIAQFFRMRAQTLKEGIRRLLNAPPDGTYMIRPVDINVARLVTHLGVADDKLGALMGTLDANTQALVDRYREQLKNDPSAAPSEELRKALADKLNQALSSPDLSRRIDTAKAEPETLAEAQKQPQGNDLLRVNHSLLHQAYPDEIAGLSDTFYNHPLIKSLGKPGEHPSYVPARTFALAVMDILSKEKAASALEGIQTSIATLPDSDVKRSLQTLAKHAGDEASNFQKSLETWYEDAMDRVSGWYKRKTQVMTIVVASVITIFANADTVRISRKLFVNPTLREKIVAAAAKRSGTAQTANVEYADTTPIPTAPVIGAPQSSNDGSALTAEEKADLGELTGWSEEFKTFHLLLARQEAQKAKDEKKSPEEIKKAEAAAKEAGTNDSFPGFALVWNLGVFLAWLWSIVPAHLLGWSLTAAAASLGAPFWFDTLNKFMNIRSAGTAPNEKNQDKSKS